MITGKDIPEDYGPFHGRTDKWPGIPEGLYRLAPVGGSTTIVCFKCRGAYDGLVYDPISDTFMHRNIMDCHRRKI